MFHYCIDSYLKPLKSAKQFQSRYCSLLFLWHLHYLFANHLVTMKHSTSKLSQCVKASSVLTNSKMCSLNISLLRLQINGWDCQDAQYWYIVFLCTSWKNYYWNHVTPKWVTSKYYSEWPLSKLDNFHNFGPNKLKRQSHQWSSAVD